MILKSFEIDDDSADEIVKIALKRTMSYHTGDPDPDSPEIRAACKKLIEYYGPSKPLKLKRKK